MNGVPLLDEIVDRVSFQVTPTMYRLAYEFGGEPTDPAWEFGAVPVTGEVRLWPPGGQEDSSFVNSSVCQWLCSLHLVGSRLTESDLFDRWDESAETEELAFAELAELLGGIEAIDPAAIADGNHERQFWPGLLDRWLF
ncbi:hypothetical protein Ate02nite_66980 [Paractinoplanes tereljensis]|uniref:SUKH-4 immunity protein of toxin-antitoxin system n=1 Tax=Paractinoplanes tereljensis TaxID=571912 RepID=A0A919NTB4_9ACTN|nr:hypothetical protein Ate02nite_66980 [Actinoplanes tereljensis]